ncbi:DUF4136 domain-containing protein [Polymorphobacter fuscus]|uniref:DUF4136 domain-containing protein n=1 Tax=Sandarakinorhabdus fusca TaxID=1439888 RepID=A0A7C9KXP4_9SPHN|nr:DUF4136 domain-containing protein [Polymorphobacter fuscus]KAB7646422.1 DUF4136 domain-containing protein [Polymorphobacter fuscus]MQT17662.1 DUF4136 domain-containing protein [Polymorphobacter fuscus]NJC09793.1 hypothetical protein [Polymorphobacter fuscus]
MKTLKFAAVPVAAAMLALAACSNNLYADVTRFHTNQPITRGTLAVVAIDPAMANNLEFRTHAETVAIQMRRLGYSTGMPAAQVDYIATVDITQADAQGNVTRPGVTVGGGVGVPIGNNAGLGANVAVPVGGSRRNPALRTTTLSVRIQRRSDNTQIWEGRATKELAANDDRSAATNAVPLLAEALFRDFPGTPGQTVRVRI